MTRRIYLSGPMSARPNWGEQDFAQAEAALQAQGYVNIVNPFTLHPEPTESLEEIQAKGIWRQTWQKYLKLDLAVLTGCDELRVISDDWQISDGARLEVYVAMRLGIPVCDMAGNPLNICIAPLTFFAAPERTYPPSDEKWNPWISLADSRPVPAVSDIVAKKVYSD